MNRILVIALLTAQASFCAQVTWSLQNVVFSDGGTATGSFVYDTSTDTVVSYSITVSGGDTSTFPAWTYQKGTNHNTGADVFISNGTIEFETDLVYGGHLRLLDLPVVVQSQTSGTVSLSLSNEYGAECYNCAPYRTFTSGTVTSTPTSPSPVPAPPALILTCTGLGAAALYELKRRLARR